MNKIVREHYPAAKLPEDLREGLEDAADVTVTIEFQPGDDETITLEEIFRLARGASPSRSVEEIDAEIRALRDEWRHRD